MITRTEPLTFVLRLNLPQCMSARGSLKSVVVKAIANAAKSQNCHLEGATAYGKQVIVTMAIPSNRARQELIHKICLLAEDEVFVRLPIFRIRGSLFL